MRVLVCGDRNWTDREMIQTVLEALPKDTIVIEGGAHGADLLAKLAADSLNLAVLEFPADWGRYGRAAGPLRNERMLKEGKPDAVHAFHDDLDHSRGTKNMIEQARKAKIPVLVHSHKGELYLGDGIEVEKTELENDLEDTAPGGWQGARR